MRRIALVTAVIGLALALAPARAAAPTIYNTSGLGRVNQGDLALVVHGTIKCWPPDPCHGPTSATFTLFAQSLTIQSPPDPCRDFKPPFDKDPAAFVANAGLDVHWSNGTSSSGKVTFVDACRAAAWRGKITSGRFKGMVVAGAGVLVPPTDPDDSFKLNGKTAFM
jgi:hypothetical protein